MSLSVFSYTVGIIDLLVGIPLLLYPQKTVAWFRQSIRDDVWVRTIGGIFLILCFLALKDDPRIGTDVAGLMRFVAWLGGVKSIVLCWWPDWMRRVRERFWSIHGMPFLHGTLACIFGILFLVAGSLLVENGL